MNGKTFNIHSHKTCPRNISDEVENARNLEGIVSKETQLSQLSFIGDAKEEMDKLESEKPNEEQYDFQNLVINHGR